MPEDSLLTKRGAALVLGPPCHHGHVGLRRATNRQCVECEPCLRTRPEARARRAKEKIRARYGITADVYERMIAEMLSVGCRICGRMPSAKNPPVVDHDHACCSGDRACGKCVRGVICKHCNVILGMSRDRPETLRKAADYLEGGWTR